MSKRLHYERAHDLSALHDALLAAGITPERVEGVNTDIWLTVPDGVDEAAVQTVVEAHDPEAIRQARAQAEADRHQQSAADLALVQQRAAEDPAFAAGLRLLGLPLEGA
jgi:hypothetical protein